MPEPNARPGKSSVGIFWGGLIGRRTRQWRISDRRDGGFDVQRRVGKLWRTTAEFPWRACD
jgi:hypothetical protein